MRFPKPWLRGKTCLSSSRSLPFPAGPHLRTALLGNRECFDAVATYPQVRWREISLFAPRVLAGTTSDLQAFAAGVFQNAWDVPSLDTAIFGLTNPGDAPLTTAQREQLWRAFHLPVYEVLFDDRGVLASECEAHEGWHIRHSQLRFDLATGAIVIRKNGAAGNMLSTGLMADGLDGVCRCGDEAPLLRGVRALESKPVRVRAAGA
jgi:hypothetical protein